MMKESNVRKRIRHMSPKNNTRRRPRKAGEFGNLVNSVGRGLVKANEFVQNFTKYLGPRRTLFLRSFRRKTPIETVDVNTFVWRVLFSLVTKRLAEDA